MPGGCCNYKNDFTIQHRKGSEHGNADGLSRQTDIKRRRCGRKECEECDIDIISPVCVLTRQAKRALDIEAEVVQGQVQTDNVQEPESACDSDSDSTDEVDSDDGDDLRGSNWLKCWNRTELREMPHHDNDIHRFIVLKESRQKCPNREELLAEDELVRVLCSQWQHMVSCTEDGHLSVKLQLDYNLSLLK